MRTTWTLVIGCVLVLGGAWFASRLLLSDVPEPVAPVAVPARPVVAPPPPSDPPMNALVLPPALARRREPGLTAPTLTAPAATPTKAQPAAEELGPAEPASSPFQGASEELDYAEGILGEAAPTRERLESALGVFKRCVDQEPGSQRCHRALTLARSMLGLVADQSVTAKISDGSGKLDQKKPAPSTQAERLNEQRPATQLK